MKRKPLSRLKVVFSIEGRVVNTYKVFLLPVLLTGGGCEQLQGVPNLGFAFPGFAYGIMEIKRGEGERPQSTPESRFCLSGGERWTPTNCSNRYNVSTIPGFACRGGAR